MISRRTFLAAASSLMVARPARGRTAAGLIADPAGILDLPAGFRYHVIQRAGDPMSDGGQVPGRPDGMGCFPSPDHPGHVVLLRNHELDRDKATAGWPGGVAPNFSFDPEVCGGVTRVEIALGDGPPRVVDARLTLTGTHRNCSGGVTPWGWVTCEESDLDGHGWCFLVETTSMTLGPPMPLKGLGRMVHEAIVRDPDTGVIWITEDRTDSCLYRLLPRGRGAFDGPLQAMAVRGAPRFATGSRLRPGDVVDIEWIDLPNPLPEDDSLRLVAQAAGAAIVDRGEGIILADGQVYFSATDGGASGLGQVLALDPVRDRLSVAVEAGHRSILDHPDGLGVDPFGNVYIAEDGSGDQFIRRIMPDGTLATLARNALSTREFAGICFSPDGRQMFCNLQKDGITLMVEGPFRTWRG